MNNQSSADNRFADVTIDSHSPRNVLSTISSSKMVTTMQDSVRSLANSTGDYLKAYPVVTLGLILVTGFAVGRVIRQQVEK